MSLVVTEIVDAGLLGEQIIPILRHAWRELLLPSPDVCSPSNQIGGTGHVIPCGAVVYVSAIQCQEVSRHCR